MCITFSANGKFIFFYFKFLLITLVLIPNQMNYSAIIEASEHKLAEIKSEFHTFLKKYKSNSCIMQIFSNFQNNCDEMTDEINSILSIEMTICMYNSLNKKIPQECADKNVTNCLKFLEGDAWTTYITFSHHIDNLCFYYKTLIWEKSSEFLFMKLLNASVGVLNELSQSSKIAEEMLNTHERFSLQMETNIVETLKNFKNFSQFFENYTKSEEILKGNIEALEIKINKSNQKMNSMAKYIDEKIEYFYTFLELFQNKEKNFNSFYFYSVLLFFSFIFTTFKSTKKSRVSLIILIIGFLFIEKYSVDFLCDAYCIHSQFFIHLGVVCCHLIFYLFRFLFSISLLIILVVKCYKYNQSKKSKKNKEYPWLTDYDSYLNITPMWMKKYFSKIKFQNEELIGKFKKMNKMIAEEKFWMNKNEYREDLDFAGKEN